MVKFMKKDNVTNEIRKIYKKVHKKEPFSFKWILKIEVIIIIVLLLFVFILNIIPNQTKFKIKYNFEKTLSQNLKNKKTNYEYSKIIESINKNTSLSENEKEFMKISFENEITENSEFINFKKINKKLENLEIYYSNSNNSSSYNYKYSKNIAGDYNVFSNKIFIYDLEDNYNKKLEDISTENKEIYFHELNHMLTDYTISSSVDRASRKLENKNNFLLKTKLFKKLSNDMQLIGKNVFTETINELFTREYLETFGTEKIGLNSGRAYSKYMPYTYVIAELLNEKTLKKYKFNDNESILINGLLEIDNNFEEVYKLIASINSSDMPNISEDELSNIYQNIYNSYSYFYEKKYNKNMNNDLVIMSYFYYSEILNQETKTKLEKVLNLNENDEIIDIIPKGYVSKNYKDTNNEVIIEYLKSGKKQTYKINNENRYLE